MKIMVGKVLKKGIVQRFCIAVLVLLTACAKESLPPKEAWIKDAREEPVYLRVDGLENAGNEKETMKLPTTDKNKSWNYVD